MSLDEQSILALAPDPGTAQRAKTVSIPQRWLRLEGDGRAVWGELGDPANPYQTAVDFNGPAFKCSCPVRRLPCKHGVGLLLMFSKKNDVFRLAEAPAWVASWLKKRDERAAKNAPEEAPPPPDPKKEQALADKRQLNRDKRLQHMSAGLAELENWLTDLLRQGLATLEGQGEKYWQELAARMVDAKLGTLARRIRTLPLLMGQPGWHERLCDEIGGIYLLMRGFQRLEFQPEALQDDLLSLAGVSVKKEDVLALEGTVDRWFVAGQTMELEENNLLARRTWLLGEASGRTALLLEFTFGGKPFDTNWHMGSLLKGELAFYPSAFPQRALFKTFELTDGAFDWKGSFPDFDVFSKAYAGALAANPWLSQFPVFFKDVAPVFQNGRFLIVDNQRKQLPVVGEENAGWKMLALSGGHPLSLFGQWDGKSFLPLSAWAGGQFQLLHRAQRPARTYPPGSSDDLPF